MKQKEVIGSGNAMGTTKILVANSKGEEIFKLKDDTITINLNNVETKKITLNNGTVLEVGEKYYINTCIHDVIAVNGDFAWVFTKDDGHHVITIPLHTWLPYTEPTPQKEWKTFLIEIDWNGYTSREIVQFESMEIAELHYGSAISIIEVKLNIEPVNS